MTINVITLGAMTTIPVGMCANVINFRFTNDKIAKCVAYPFEKVRCISDTRERKVINLEGKGFHAHGVEEYLNVYSVHLTIKQMGMSYSRT